jgi:YbgC/YbaW family acyl-CoA thioester hydrolase
MGAFSTVIPVRFGHVDPAGIVYFPRIFDYIHEAFEDVWDVHVGVRYYHLLMEQRIGFPTVSSKVEFAAPLRFGDRPVVSVSCMHLGRSSLGLRYVFRIGDQVHVEAEMTTVCTDLEAMKSQPIEEGFRARFEEIME